MRQFIAFDAILLLICSLPVVFGYRILPVQGTPYWLFGVLFLILIGNVLFSVYAPFSQKIVRLTKTILFFLALVIVVGGVSITAMVDRQKGAPIYGVHDIILQQEAAMRFLLEGKNPYKETYFNTPLADWHYAEEGKDVTNPALYHFVMPPWYLVFPYIFYFLSLPLFGFFDGRMALLFAAAGTTWVLLRLYKNEIIARSAIVLVLMAPGVIDYFIEGRSDAFALFWFLWAMYLLEKKKVYWSSLIFGLAMLSKQTLWFAFPFYLVLLWKQAKGHVYGIGKFLLPMIVAFISIALPFILWDGQAFISSVILYLSGGTPGGYPVSGYGLGMVLHEAGIIKDIHDYYPFIMWQAVIGLPVAFGSAVFLLKKPVLSRMFLGFAVTLAAFWYTSRYFNNSHAVFVGTLLALGVTKHWDESEYEK